MPDRIVWFPALTDSPHLPPPTSHFPPLTSTSLGVRAQFDGALQDRPREVLIPGDSRLPRHDVDPAARSLGLDRNGHVAVGRRALDLPLVRRAILFGGGLLLADAQFLERLLGRRRGPRDGNRHDRSDASIVEVDPATGAGSRRGEETAPRCQRQRHQHPLLHPRPPMVRGRPRGPPRSVRYPLASRHESGPSRGIPRTGPWRGTPSQRRRPSSWGGCAVRYPPPRTPRALQRRARSSRPARRTPTRTGRAPRPTTGRSRRGRAPRSPATDRRRP